MCVHPYCLSFSQREPNSITILHTFFFNPDLSYSPIYFLCLIDAPFLRCALIRYLSSCSSVLVLFDFDFFDTFDAFDAFEDFESDSSS